MDIEDKILREITKKPRTSKQLKKKFRLEEKQAKTILKNLLLNDLIFIKEGVFYLKKDKGVQLPAKLVKLGRAFGFAQALDNSGDVFIPGRSLMGALPGDELLVQLSIRPRVAGSREGEVVEITKENNRVSGSVEVRGKRVSVKLDNAPDTYLWVAKGSLNSTFEGEKVAGEVVRGGDRHDDHRVSITMRFGKADTAKKCTDAILYSNGIERDFSNEVLEEAEALFKEGVPQHEAANRLDLRNEIIFTIDSSSTKDIDDAISVKKIGNGYELGVHIADVSYYVPPKSEADKQAFLRSTSIYFADSVVPMLAPQYSNGICSLNPNEDRLAFSCLLKLDKSGKLKDYTFKKTIIKSCLKGVYDEINEIYANNASDELDLKYSKVEKTLALMNELYKKLDVLRRARGSMEIESDEPVLVLNEKGICVEVQKRLRGKAERIIEEFMLLANGAAANFASKKKLPFLYRVHDKPSEDRVANLKNVLVAAGVDFRFENDIPTQAEYAKLLEETRATKIEKLVHNAVLRSMAKAAYEADAKGHFGLALEDYAHFTSPIRRYPDLIIHRILSDFLIGMNEEQIGKRYKEFVKVAASQTTQKEITAQQIERSCEDCYKAEYMQGHLGEVFVGVISSVVSFGLYVQLENFVEGLIHISHLSTSQMNLVEGVSLANPLSGKVYKLGDSISVKVAGVDLSRGNVDFTLNSLG